MILKVFVYGTLKQGFPLSIQSHKDTGIIANITTACLNYGQLYTQNLPSYPYLVLNQHEYNNYTVPAPNMQKSITDSYKLGFIQSLRKKAWQYFPIIGELVEIEGTPQQLLKRLRELDRIEGFDGHGMPDNHYERRKMIVTNYPGEHHFATLAWGYCLQPDDPYIARLERIEENEWLADLWADFDCFKELNEEEGTNCMECDKECSCDCPVFKAQVGY